MVHTLKVYQNVYLEIFSIVNYGRELKKKSNRKQQRIAIDTNFDSISSQPVKSSTVTHEFIIENQ